MKVVSVITGIGYGHAIRQAAILSELEKKGAEIVVASYGNALEYFKHEYTTLEIGGPKFPERHSRFSTMKTIMMNLKLPSIYLRNYLKLKQLHLKFLLFLEFLINLIILGDVRSELPSANCLAMARMSGNITFCFLRSCLI